MTEFSPLTWEIVGKAIIALMIVSGFIIFLVSNVNFKPEKKKRD